MKISIAKLSSNFTNFCIYFLSFYANHLIGLVFFAAMIGCYGTVSTYLIKILVDIIVEPNFDFIDSSIPCILFILSFTVHNFAWRAIDRIIVFVAPNLRAQIIEEVFKYTLEQPLKFFKNNFSGSISNNVLILAENIEQLTLRIAPFIIRSLVQLVLALVSMYFVHPIFTFALFFWVVVFIWISFNNAEKIKYLSNIFSRNYSILSGTIIDSISNMQSVTIFGQKYLEHSYLRTKTESFKKSYIAKESYLLLFWLKQGISIIFLLSVVLLTLIYLRKHNFITIGDFTFIIGLVLCVCENIWEFSHQFSQMNDMIGKCKQSLDFLITAEKNNQIFNVNKYVIYENINLEFENVVFSYEPKEVAIKIKKLKISSKEKIAVVGHSGSGKTTFVNLILRLFKADSGQILINKQNINNIEDNIFVGLVGAIPQNPTLFHRSIEENIRYAKPEASEQEIIEAAKAANAHEFICEFSEGYKTMVGEMGLKLSGGQKQRIAIARLFLKNPQILLLDEATSQLDARTESYIQKSLNSLMTDKITIIIAHNLSTIMQMDRILVFDKGRIIGDDSHDNLIKNNSIYKKLWQNSFKE